MSRRKLPQHKVQLVKWPDGQFSLRIRNTNNDEIIFWTEKYKRMEKPQDQWDKLVADIRARDIPIELVRADLVVVNDAADDLTRAADADKG